MPSENNLKLSLYKSAFLSCNLYLLENEEGQIVIDPCAQFEVVFREREVNLKGIIITHCHFDHLLKIDEYLKNSTCPVYIHGLGKEKLNDPLKNGGVLVNRDLRFYIPDERIIEIDFDQEINLLGKKFRFMETPGHSSCSLCILVDDYLFTGDTLFKGSIGRTDLYSSDINEMNHSLDKILALDKDYQVLPGHQDITLLSEEKRNNPFLKRRRENV
jgi:glyoxylase-like metal-dependent hydrolase (beta-lactamase superfamily II)